MLLPNEESLEIQEILKGDFTIRQKSYQIENFYKSKIPYNRTPGTKREHIKLYRCQIEDELLKRGDDLQPLDIDL